MGGSKGARWWTASGLFILVWAVFPLLWMVSLSFKDPNTFRSSSPSFFPTKWVWTNYKTVFSDSLFTSALRNSIGIAVIATLLSVVVAMFAAYAIARLEFPGKKILLSTHSRSRCSRRLPWSGHSSTCGATSASTTRGSA